MMIIKASSHLMKTSVSIRDSGCPSAAFSLIELLTVIALMGILIAVAVPVLSGQGRDMTRAADTMSDIFQQARTRAMSKNTYVYVGMAPTDEPDPELAVAVVESRDGLSSKTNDLATDPEGAGIQPIRQVVFLRGVEINTTSAKANLPASFIRPNAEIEVLEVDDGQSSLIRFPADVVTRRGNIRGSQFEWVIQFSPDGAARLDTSKRTVPDYIVFGFVPSRGGEENAVGVVIDGTCGSIRVVRNDS